MPLISVKDTFERNDYGRDMTSVTWYKRDFDPRTVGILLTSHPRQQMFWDECLPSWEGSPYYVLLGYDDVNDDKIKDHLRRFPGVKDHFVTGSRTGHVCGELTQLKMGFDILHRKGFYYSMKLAADFRVKNYDGIKTFWQLIEGIYPQMPDQGKVQTVGDSTAFMFGCSGILSVMLSDFDRHRKKGGSAEQFVIRRKRQMNISTGYFNNTIFNVLDMLHVQGQYAKDHKTSIQGTWAIGEVWK